MQIGNNKLLKLRAKQGLKKVYRKKKIILEIFTAGELS